MDIIFKSRKFEREYNKFNQLERRYGPLRARLIRRRLDDFRAAENLEVMRTLPQAGCHELIGNRKGQLAVNLDHPYRLIFIPANNPVPLKEDGGLDWGKVTAIEIIAVEDYHKGGIP